MNDLEKYTKLGHGAINGLCQIGNIGEKIYQRYILKYADADNYLKEAILEKGKPQDVDMEIAARLYAIPQMRKYYKNISKILIKTGQLYEHWGGNKDEEIEINEDWFNYFLDKAKIVSDEDVQMLWAAILTKECFEKGGFRKVMLDRLALLDRKSAALFQLLCGLTYNIEISDNRSYTIPLYIRGDIIQGMIRNNEVCFSKEDMNAYRRYFKLEGQLLSEMDLEDELEILQEVGLIKLSEEQDDCDIYSTDMAEFMLKVDNELSVEVIPQHDQNTNVYYILTGNATFTKMGLELYHILKKNTYRPDFFLRTVQAFMDYQTYI